MGVVNILKILSQSSGPTVTGLLAGNNHFWVAFVAAGCLKAVYDVLLLVFFGGRVESRKHAITRQDEDRQNTDEGIDSASGEQTDVQRSA